MTFQFQIFYKNMFILSISTMKWPRQDVIEKQFKIKQGKNIFNHLKVIYVYICSCIHSLMYLAGHPMKIQHFSINHDMNQCKCRARKVEMLTSQTSFQYPSNKQPPVEQKSRLIHWKCKFILFWIIIWPEKNVCKINIWIKMTDCHEVKF